MSKIFEKYMLLTILFVLACTLCYLIVIRVQRINSQNELLINTYRLGYYKAIMSAKENGQVYEAKECLNSFTKDSVWYMNEIGNR